jgi:hypothetical protein
MSMDTFFLFRSQWFDPVLVQSGRRMQYALNNPAGGTHGLHKPRSVRERPKKEPEASDEYFCRVSVQASPGILF